MRHVPCLALALLASLPAAATQVPAYVDEAVAAGVNHSYTGGWEFFVGGGVAAFDCDGDRDPDLAFAGGSSPAGLYRNVGEPGLALAFEQVTGSPLAVTGVSGIYPLDIDGDGIMDLVALRVGANGLFRGLGDCAFELANEAWGFETDESWSTAFSATWEEGARLPTLAIANYVDRSQPGAPFGTCHDNQIYRPEGEAYVRPISLSPGYCALSALFSDWDRDGVPDLRLSNDRQYYRGGHEQLIRLPPGEPPREYGPQDSFRELKIWGMGIASWDVDGNGLPDYFLTSMTDNKLQSLTVQGFGQTLRPTYDDVALDFGVTLHRPYTDDAVRPSTAWHAEFGDVNNDGMIDLFVAKGNVEGMTDFAAFDPNNLVLGEPGPSFREAAPEAGIVTPGRARGGSLVDLNLDGLLDLVVVNREAPVEVWRNLGAGEDAEGRSRPLGSWAEIELFQPGPNRRAVGAWIEIRTAATLRRQEVTVGGGHASGEAGWIHFGLGTAEIMELRVQWPDGTWSPWLRTFAGQFLIIPRNATAPRMWYPAPGT